eukprot:CAMPEP_0202692312 /NCGR_PEP_ID=MMETSP1385-20130828/6718_1 /ASSEMBLY_ACC=CAM_ASM_000861 /TAXON_ID=933848 /ORGANISM="Elphidium margaritaceum" /LENGTH=495 /DNA_ID=CAMNT_0049347821 /DNA_START=97 /DNA_END=1584 /DNA_ORIENTATION=+
MAGSIAASRFRPTPRDYSYETLLYVLEKGPVGMALMNLVPSYLLWSLVPGLSARYITLLWLYVLVPLTVVVVFLASMIWGAKTHSEQYWNNSTVKMPDWSNTKATGVEFVDQSLLQKYRNRKIPMETAIELYFAEKINFVDTKQVMLQRYDLFTFVFTWGHISWFLFTFLGQLTGHTMQRDAREVGDVYNRGNDFYGWFLGPSMVYTSGIFRAADYKGETLESAQQRKIDTILDSLHVEKGDRHLDIGCGWGTLVINAAKRGALSTGCTLAKEQVAFAKAAAKKENVEDKCTWLTNDYRLIPNVNGGIKYDKISCVEMAEHVGIKNFTPFLAQVHAMLKDDGLFYIQMCGVRRCWFYEDIVWILFMGKYIFPGADASTNVAWVINQLERSGFEVHRVENCSAHYARTIEMWHDNWTANKEPVVAKYGQWWFRLWDVFLAWSSLIGKQSSSSVFMMTCHKHLCNDGNSMQSKIRDAVPKLNRTKLFIGDKPVGYQQ